MLASVREEFREFLVRHTKCEIQPDPDGLGWPCGTCAIDLLRRLGVNPKAPEFNEHNAPVDRLNEVWRAIQMIRFTTKPKE